MVPTWEGQCGGPVGGLVSKDHLLSLGWCCMWTEPHKASFPAVPCKHTFLTTSHSYQEVCPEDRLKWVDAGQIQREGRVGFLLNSVTELVTLIPYSGYFTYLVFIWLMHLGRSVYLLMYKSCLLTRLKVKGRHSLCHCFENRIFVRRLLSWILGF